MNKFPMIATICAGALATTLAGGALQAKTYTCNVTPDFSRDWISKTLVFNIDDTSGAVRVFDGILEVNGGKPVAGKLSVETAKRRTITWTTRQVRDGHGHSSARFLFRASYYKNNGKMIISSMPGGWDNRFGGSGHCSISSDAGWDAAVKTAKTMPFLPRGKSAFFVAGEWIKFPP